METNIMKLYDFEFEGKKYKQKKLPEIAEIVGMNYMTLFSRLEKISIQEAIDKDIQNQNSSSKLYDFEFKGKKYKQKKAKEVAEIIGIKYATLLTRLRRMPIQDAINKDIQKRNSSKLYDFEFKGKQYSQKNLKEVAAIVGVSYQTLVSRMKKMPIQDAINKPVKNHSSKLYDFEFKGKKYRQKNLKESAEIIGINYMTLSYHLERMSIQETINKLDHKQDQDLYNFEFNLKQYYKKSLNEVSEITGISYPALVSRLNREKIDLQEAIDKYFIISEDGHYYNFDRVSEEFHLEVKQVKKLKKLGFTYEDFKNK